MATQHTMSHPAHTAQPSARHGGYEAHLLTGACCMLAELECPILSRNRCKFRSVVSLHHSALSCSLFSSARTWHSRCSCSAFFATAACLFLRSVNRAAACTTHSCANRAAACTTHSCVTHSFACAQPTHLQSSLSYGQMQPTCLLVCIHSLTRMHHSPASPRSCRRLVLSAGPSLLPCAAAPSPATQSNQHCQAPFRACTLIASLWSAASSCL